jgi:hypothetical protein
LRFEAQSLYEARGSRQPSFRQGEIITDTPRAIAEFCVTLLLRRCRWQSFFLKVGQQLSEFPQHANTPTREKPPRLLPRHSRMRRNSFVSIQPRGHVPTSVTEKEGTSMPFRCGVVKGVIEVKQKGRSPDQSRDGHTVRQQTPAKRRVAIHDLRKGKNGLAPISALEMRSPQRRESDLLPVTSEVAGSIPVVPAIPFSTLPSLFKYLPAITPRYGSRPHAALN